MIPKVIGLAVLGGLLPAFFWLWFWLREDRENPEPKKIIALTFFLGGLYVFLALWLEQAVSNINISQLENFRVSPIFNYQNFAYIFPFLSVFFVWALIEEFVKYLAALVGAFPRRSFDEPVDAVIYMITAALGFSAVENMFFGLNSLCSGAAGFNFSQLVCMGAKSFDFLMSGNLRFLGATPLHILSSAVVGVFIALAFYKKGWGKIFYILGGLLTASLLHTFFNFFIIINGGQYLFPLLIVLWVLTIALMVLFEMIKAKKIKYVQR